MLQGHSAEEYGRNKEKNMTGGKRDLHDKELNNLYSLNIIRVIKQKRMILGRYVVTKGEINLYIHIPSVKYEI